MPLFDKFVEIGRVVWITAGPDQGKVAAISEIIDGNRALIDGPLSGVKRQPLKYKYMILTDFVLPIRHGARSGTIAKAWEAEGIEKKWSETPEAKKQTRKGLRSKMNDYDRFKLRIAKRMRNRIIRTEVNKLKKSGK